MAMSGDHSYIEQLPRERTYLLPALHLVQEREGLLTPEALTAVGLHLKVANSELYGIARSYSELRVEPTAGTTVGVCTGLSCLLNGGRDLLEGVRGALAGRGPEVVETTCRFRCAEAPVAAAGDGYVVAATVDRVTAAVGSG